MLLNTLFLREHNRVAGELAAAYPRWDDERLFQTARNVMIVLLIKIVIEEYINHITPYHFRLAADPAPFKNERWYRPNWMAVEFNLLYRWHGLIPSRLHGGPVWKTIFNPAFVVERGVAALIDDASRTRAGRVGPFNTDPALREVELASIRTGRALSLAPYNDYRELAKLPARDGVRPAQRRPARCRRCWRSSTGRSTGSSSSPACSPRTRGRTPCCRR